MKKNENQLPELVEKSISGSSRIAFVATIHCANLHFNCGSKNFAAYSRLKSDITNA